MMQESQSAKYSSLQKIQVCGKFKFAENSSLQTIQVSENSSLRKIQVCGKFKLATFQVRENSSLWKIQVRENASSRKFKLAKIQVCEIPANILKIRPVWGMFILLFSFVFCCESFVTLLCAIQKQFNWLKRAYKYVFSEIFSVYLESRAHMLSPPL